jgi:enoyl-CoA hydratase
MSEPHQYPIPDYDKYRYLDVTVEEDTGVAIIEMTHPRYEPRGHWEMSNIWLDIDDDPRVRACVWTWAVPPTKEPLGAHTRSDMQPWNPTDDPAGRYSLWQQSIKEARDSVNRLLDSPKIVVSALHGEVPWGQSLILATLADISIVSETAEIWDGHVPIGMVAGDGAVFWSAFMGVQRAKFYALTGERMTGKQAADWGLVSKAVPEAEVRETALRYAREMADGPRHSLNYTKRAFNQPLKTLSITTHEHGNALEVIGLLADPDVATIRTSEGFNALQGDSPDGTWVRPRYPSTDKPYGPAA